MSRETYFKASLDTTAKVTTILVTLLFAAVAWITLDVVGRAQKAPMVALPALVLVYGISFALSPRGYLVSEDAVTVLQRFGKKRLPRASIERAEPVAREDLLWTIRTFGVGGLFGYYGKFANRKLGSMSWYLTRRDKAVLLRMKDGRNILLSPDDQQEFINAIAY
ncbi:hypothetical protein EPD60_01630 [Flaviaesturariibacter flavus]|uniref:Bacterial Pleckstrin homology domain-containing protein n=1 Tax=Flaviaesturariibacter flavus TaxID=2502780 RepID=A0A4R1BNT2_9BACT|nr:PH domain-containing protein [Flaviaesturariibacter flavus]TCJ19141.1 hypothetical protein EPD60_01630 [Flaviaesturariibacter flavus]